MTPVPSARAASIPRLRSDENPTSSPPLMASLVPTVLQGSLETPDGFGNRLAALSGVIDDDFPLPRLQEIGLELGRVGEGRGRGPDSLGRGGSDGKNPHGLLPAEL